MIFRAVNGGCSTLRAITITVNGKVTFARTVIAPGQRREDFFVTAAC
jgi:hypothetical protein